MMMLYLITAICVAYACAEKPEFCGRRECPRFNVIEKTEKYELREYEPSTWVEATSSDFSSRNLFRSLFRYIQGQNVEDKRIQMTKPVLSEHTWTGESWVDNRKMLFYMDQDDPPQSNDNNVRVVRMPTMRVYVRVYGGRTNDFNEKSHLRSMMEAIPDDVNIDTSSIYVAGYDGPRTYYGRRNELWLIENTDTE